MTYLITQIFLLLLVAAVLGVVLGWYLTRMTAATASDRLRGQLKTALANAESLRAERDAATTARDSAEHARRLMSDDLNDTQAKLAAAQSAGATDVAEDNTALDALRAELDECRTALEAVSAPASGNEQVADTAAIASAAAAAASGAQGLMGEAKPIAPNAVEGPADDLRQIKGIGPKIAGILNDLGVRRYAQIAAWTPEDVDSINEHLKFKGRVEREGWIEQAKALQ